MLINLSNHPSDTWSDRHLQAACEHFGEIVDIVFPVIDPTLDESGIDLLAVEYLGKINEIAVENNIKPVVHLMGEYSFCYQLVNLLKAEGIESVVSTSERQTQMNPDGSKTIQFNFVRFRNY